MRRLPLVLAMLTTILAVTLLALSTGNTFPGTCATVARASNTDWTSPTNAQADDAATASAAVPTDYLVCSNYGFSIPAAATLLGYTFRVEAHETGGGTSNYIPQLCSDTTPTLVGSAKSAVSVAGTTPTVSTNGGAADLWSTSLTVAQVNSSSFCGAIWSDDTTNTLLVDYVTIAVEYSVGGPQGIINNPIRGGGVDLRWSLILPVRAGAGSVWLGRQVRRAL